MESGKKNMYLRCPECHMTNNPKKNDIMNAVCEGCGFNLYAYYFANKTDTESKTFISKENQRIKTIQRKHAEQQRREYAEELYEEAQEEEKMKRWIYPIAYIGLGMFFLYLLIDYFSGMSWTVEYAIVDGEEYELTSYKISTITKKNDVFYIGPKQQKFMRDLIETTKSSIPSDANDVLKKRTWINASRQLCASSAFDAFSPKINWFGYVSHISMDDDGDVGLILRIDEHDNTVFDGDVPNRLENILLRLNEEDIVRFSGRFKKGKSSENECLRAGYTSSPELYDETFMFDFTQIEKIEVKKVKVEKN